MSDQDWTPPTAKEVREYLTMHGLTGAAAAQLVRVNSRTFRRYMAHTKPLTVPYAVWYTLQDKTLRGLHVKLSTESP